jgi:hypothetical protein
MRALHFNPWRRTVAVIDLDGDGDGDVAYESLREAVFFGRPARQRGYLRRVELDNGLVAFVDDDAWGIPCEEQRFVHLGEPWAGVDLAGHVVVATDDGWGGARELPRHVCASTLRVQWLDAREVAEGAEKHA